MAADDDSVSLALEELEREPLPTHTREHKPPEEAVEVDYDDESGENRQNLPETDEKPAETVEKREIDADEGIDALRQRLLAAESGRREAETRAQAAERARAEQAGQTQDANVSFLTSALEGVRGNLSILKSNLSEAYAVQDWNAVGDIQVEIARHAQRESQIEAGLEQLKAMPRDAPRQPQRAEPTSQVEQVAAQLTPNAAAWVRAHPDYITDPGKNARLMSAHYAAMGEGLEGDSPEYIQFVERHVGLGRAEPRQQSETRRETVAENRRSAPPAAPVNRGNGGANNPTRVTLTREQREMARELFPDELQEDPSGRKSEQAYARNMLILKREGRLN